MTIPTRAWNPVPVSGDLGSYIDWTGEPVDGEFMVVALVVVLKAFMLPTTEFDQVTAYTQETPTSPNIPRKSIALGIAGTSTEDTPSQAVSATFNFKTVGNGDVKLVLLDTPIGGTWFAPVFAADFGAPVLAVESVFIDEDYAFSGRDDTRPAVLRKLTKDLNDKLQKEYWK
jgi:hypothetical protein